MAANRKQGSYLAEFIVAFTMFPAGLVLITSASRGIGTLLTIVGLGLLLHSAVGLYRIKKLEFSRGS
ncbi:MAG: hypothetical protein LAN62_00995 [Acidobacteriia bacterium]|nr:hypothetical protein [Terriglobia bacterium]